MLWATVLIALAAPPDDAGLDAHLARWEKAMAGADNIQAKFELKRTESLFKKDRLYTGRMVCMKPGALSLRLESKTDKTDYEEYLFTGTSLYAIDGRLKTVTEFKVDQAAVADSSLLALFNGMTAADVKKRFAVALLKVDEHYVYLDIRPIAGKDKQEIEKVQFALFGPTTKTPYMPALMLVYKPNGDTEQWKFPDPQTNVPGIDKKTFELKMPPGFTFRKPPPVTPRP